MSAQHCLSSYYMLLTSLLSPSQWLSYFLISLNLQYSFSPTSSLGLGSFFIEKTEANENFLIISPPNLPICKILSAFPLSLKETYLFPSLPFVPWIPSPFTFSMSVPMISPSFSYITFILCWVISRHDQYPLSWENSPPNPGSSVAITPFLCSLSWQDLWIIYCLLPYFLMPIYSSPL